MKFRRSIYSPTPHEIHFQKLQILVRGTPLLDISNPQEIGDFNMGEIGQIQPGRAVITELICLRRIPILSRDVYCFHVVPPTDRQRQPF